jgi:hypothetical protein
LANQSTPKKEDAEQRDKLTSLAEKIRKAQEMNTKQEDKVEVMK